MKKWLAVSLRALVVAQAVLVLVPRQHVHRLGAAAAMVLQVDVLHVAIGAQHDPHHELVADADRLAVLDRLEHRALSWCRSA